MDDLDFDIGDWLGSIESGLDISGGDTSWLDTVDWGSMLQNMDFSNLDLSNVVGNIGAGGLESLVSGAGNFAEDVEEQAGGFYGNMPGRAVYDPKTNTTQLYNPTTDTFRTITHGDAGDIADQLASDFWRNQFGMGQDDYEDDLTSDFWRNILTGGGDDAEQGNVIVTGTKDTDTGDDEEEEDGVGTVVITGTKDDEEDDENPPVECPPGSERRVTQPDGAVWTYNCKGELIDKTEPPGDDTCPPGSETTQTFDDGSTITYDCKGNVISSTPSTDDKCPPNSNTTETLADGTVVVKDCKGNVISTTKPTTKPDTKTKTTTTSNDLAKYIALLGGLLGLLDRPKGGPAGYKGGIPKYTATRGPSRSPTEGGRRPGGAGIGSLTGGVTYTPVVPPVGAAYGGLMGLATGGSARPARYLRGGTDGMADKIQTNIDGKQPARLSHGEFVIPADVVSHLGNGNSDAGADVLYDMMAKVRKARTGNPKQGKQINPRKYTPV